MEQGDLVATEHEHLVVDHAETERLKEAGGETFPSQRAQALINARHPPHVAVDGADKRRAIAQKIDPRKKHQRSARIVVRHRERIDGKKVGRIAEPATRSERGPPARRAWTRELGERRGR